MRGSRLKVCRLLSLLAAAWMLVVAPVNATIVTVNFDGTITTGTDFTNMFGGGLNSSLAGQHISGDAVYNDIYLTPADDQCGGPPFFCYKFPFVGSGILTVHETIAGRTLTIGGSYYEEIDFNLSTLAFVEAAQSDTFCAACDFAGGHNYFDAAINFQLKNGSTHYEHRFANFLEATDEDDRTDFSFRIDAVDLPEPAPALAFAFAMAAVVFGSRRGRRGA